MNWRFSPELEGEPAGWSGEAFPTAREARAAGRLQYDGVLYTAWVEAQDYAALMAPVSAELAEMREAAAARGADTECFEQLTDAQTRVLEGLLRRAMKNWEAWLPLAARSTVQKIENVERHEPPAV